MSEAPVICDVKIELYSKNSGRLSQTIEEKLVLQDKGEVSKLDHLLGMLHGEWDEYYITHRPATCGDCEDCNKDAHSCPYSVNVDIGGTACHFFKLRE